MSIERYEVGPLLSSAAVHGDTAYLAGMTADDLAQDVAGQTAETLARIDRILALVGSDKSKILRAEIWISDMANFAAMNTVYLAWADPDNRPPRACVESRLWTETCLVEIMVTAAV